MKTKPLPPVINLMVGTAGHIDHGKTELVKFFTGCETDTLKEEKDRGMSINLGFAPCPLGRGKRIGLVDVPGHEDFIRNMVAGATGIDIVMLVVAADDGIMPQTVEHFNITELLGVKRGIVVISKTDLVQPERIEEVKADLKKFLKGTYMENAPVFPFSAVTAEGLSDLRKMLDEIVDETERRLTEGVFRLPVERSFSAEGFGTIMTGIAARGKLSIRDQVEILPTGQKGTVRKLQVFGQDWDEGYAGQCLAVNVGGVDSKVVQRGFVLATAGYFKPADIMHARLRILPNAEAPFKNRTPVRFHTGTTESLGTAVVFEKDALEPGETGLVQFLLERPLIVEPGDSYVIRLQNPVITVGGGKIIGHSDKRFKRKRSWIVDTMSAEEKSLAGISERAEFVIGNAGMNGLDRKDLAIRATLTTQQTDTLLTDFSAAGKAVILPGNRLVVSAGHFAEYKDALLAKLGELHAADSMRIGYTAVEIRKATDAGGELTTAALDDLAAAGSVVHETDRYRLATFQVKLDDGLSQIATAIENIYRNAKFKTPRPDELKTALEASRIEGSEKDILKILDQLVESGTLVRTTPQIIFHRDSVEEARKRVVAHITEHGDLDSYHFKNLIESSRKYAIPLLDHFDAVGVTVRGHQNKRYLKS